MVFIREIMFCFRNEHERRRLSQTRRFNMNEGRKAKPLPGKRRLL